MRIADIDEWRASMVEPLWDADVAFTHQSQAHDLHGEVESLPVGPALVNAIDIKRGCPAVSRGRARIAQSTKPLGFGLSVVKHGHAVVATEGREVALGPGDVCLLSGAVPFAKRLSRDYQESLYLAPHDVLADMLGPTLERAPCVVSAHAGFGRVLALQVETLVTHGASAVPEHAARLADSTHRLLGAVFGMTDSATSDELKRCSLRDYHRRRVLDAIAEGFRDPELDPAAVAQRCRFSVRYLHALFAGEDSFSRRLLAHRLDHCLSELTSPHPLARRRSIGEIAFAAGFNNLAHFCRTFKARFGMTPSDARATR